MASQDLFSQGDKEASSPSVSPTDNKSSTSMNKESVGTKDSTEDRKSIPHTGAYREETPKSTPVKMYSTPNILSQATPQKETGSACSQAETPKKTPTKVKTHDLKHVQEKVEKFCTELDTGFKACLYSVMKNETQDISTSLERLRRKTKAFSGEINFCLTECIKNITAMIQKEATLEQQTKHLDREKKYIQKEIKDLKRPRELQEIENLLNQSDDDVAHQNRLRAKKKINE